MLLSTALLMGGAENLGERGEVGWEELSEAVSVTPPSRETCSYATARSLPAPMEVVGVTGGRGGSSPSPQGMEAPHL